MISPGYSDLMSPGARGVLAVWFWHRRSRVVNLESRLEGLVFLLLLLWACGRRSCVVQAQRHVHSATCSGLSAGGFTSSPQALAVEIDPVGVMDQAVEDGVGVGGIADQRVPLIDGAERAQQTRMAAVAARQSEFAEQPRDALIEHRAIVAAGLVAKRRRKPALADAGGSADQQIGVVVDPAAFDQHRQQAAVETARGAIVDVFDA